MGEPGYPPFGLKGGFENRLSAQKPLLGEKILEDFFAGRESRHVRLIFAYPTGQSNKGSPGSVPEGSLCGVPVEGTWRSGVIVSLVASTGKPLVALSDRPLCGPRSWPG